MKLVKWIKPRDGLIVTDPETGRALRPEGEEVVWTGWWQRRLNDGDVIETTEQAAKAAARKADRAGEGEK